MSSRKSIQTKETDTSVPYLQNYDSLIGAPPAIVAGGSGNDFLIPTTASNTYYYGYDGDDVIIAGPGEEHYFGGTGTDWVHFGYSAIPVFVDLSKGVRTGYSLNVTFDSIENLVGSIYSDNLTGDSKNNILWGESGDDVLDGGAGNDQLDGGAGIDTVIFNGSSVSVDLLNGTAIQGLFIDQLRSIENVRGTSYGDFIKGDNNDNYLDGGAGDDLLTGLDGNNTLVGGEGSDTVSYVFSKDMVLIDLQSREKHGHHGAYLDILVGIENAIGSNNSDFIEGSGENNILRGGTGSDYLLGNAGDDTLSTSADGNYDVIYGGGGNDTITSGYWNNGDDGQNLMVGGPGHDTINGGAGYDVILGGGSFRPDVPIPANNYDDGNDVINGGAGDDQINGGGGSNTLDGGADRDTVIYATSTTSVDVSLANQTGTHDGQSVDRLLNFENVIGSNFDDVLRGNEKDNLLLGGGGNDRIYAGAGRDTLSGQAGRDTFVFENFADQADVVLDFQLGSGGDYLDVHSVLSLTSFNNGLGGSLGNFLRLTNIDNIAHLQVNATGASSGGQWADLALIGGVATNTTLDTLLAHNQLIT